MILNGVLVYSSKELKLQAQQLEFENLYNCRKNFLVIRAVTTLNFSFRTLLERKYV